MRLQPTGSPKGRSAVMAGRIEPVDSLDYFPTPPWATRALMQHVLVGVDTAAMRAWEPAAGEGHMAEVLKEYFADVKTSDVHDYGKGYEIGSFVGQGPDVMVPYGVHWIITNPPFSLAIEFAERALGSGCSVALLVRTAWLESADRFARLFAPRPPSIVALFSERVPMVKGRWDPKASSATSYSWVVWHRNRHELASRLVWIPPGQRTALTRPDDVARFG